MNNSNFFSVILPCITPSQAVTVSIHSVIKQQYQNFELLLMVLQKDEQELDKLIAFQENSSKIKKVVMPYGDEHVANVWGIKNATGNFVCFLSPGDEWYVHHLNEFDNAIKNFMETKVFFTRSANSINSKHEPIRVSEKASQMSNEDFKPGFKWTLTQLCVKRNFANEESLPALKFSGFSEKFIISCLTLNVSSTVINKITCNSNGESRKINSTKEIIDNQILTTAFISRNKLFNLVSVKKQFMNTYFWLLGHLLRNGSFITFIKYLIRYIKTIRRINFNHR